MKVAVIFVACFVLNFAQCSNSESFENNGIEESPLYETIIYSDIADIINEFENNNVPFEKATNESESDEDVEDLLSEYHRYLEKAHKQRVNYLEKSKLKNKIPIIRHEKFTKLKSLAAGKHKEHYKNGYYNSDNRFPQALNPFNMFIPYNSNKYLTTSEQPVYNEGFGALKKFSLAETPLSSFSSIPLKSSCYCKDGRSSCKKCLAPMDRIQQKTYPNIMLPDEEKSLILNDPLNTDLTGDTLNIRIKVEVQVPKAQNHNQLYNQNLEKMPDYENGLSKEYLSAIKLPSPYFNFPIPINLFGYKRISQSNKYDTLLSSPLHRLTIHKKKKSKLGNGLKKHRKKVITFHNIKIEPQLLQTQFETYNVSENIKNVLENNNSNIILSQETNVPTNTNLSSIPNTFENTTDNQTEENIILLVNITNNIENGTNETHKTENSIETDVIPNATTDIPIHLLRKRETQSENKSAIIKTAKKSIVKKKTSLRAKTNSTKLIKNNIKKNDRTLPPETELLYWPSNTVKKNKDISKNITAIILESENKREKLNMSAETLRLNHTRVLEQAIFGNVDWNDVDSVAPAFISFFGKYIEGIITFCSEHICHSMKCAKKNCIHRVCTPQDRFNNIGHCTGSNNTDSAASMESIMDLPSNIAFEIVEILKDRMIGKLFGKITICINSKCITFASSKKLFLKNKCTEKELSHKGHCVKSKEAKVT